MQTFLPYPSFCESARCLDNKRLGKQRVEAWQIYRALTVPGYGWQNHPAVKMWKGHLSWLLFYGLKVCTEWDKRGCVDNLYDIMHPLWTTMFDARPSWLGNEKFHSAHRAILLAKNYDWYKKFGWSEKPAEKNKDGKWPYIWPI